MAVSPPDGENFTVKEIVLRIERTLNDRADRIEAAMTARADDHEGRIRSLEHWKWGLPAAGFAAVLAALATLFGGPPL